MTGLGVLALFVGAFVAWGLTLALIWQAFRSWQYLMDLGTRQTLADAARDGPAERQAGGWDDFSRGQLMALRARIVLKGMPDGVAGGSARYGQRFRRAVIGLIALSCAVGAIVALLEPALWGAVRLFLAGMALWAGAHLVMLWRWSGAVAGA